MEGGGRLVRRSLGEVGGGAAKSGAIAPQIAEIRPAMHWAALRAAHQMLPEKGKSFILERVTGVEPVSRPWQGRIIAAILYPLFGASGQNRTDDASLFRSYLDYIITQLQFF